MADIHEACSRQGIDWEKLTRKAKQYGWEEVLRLTMVASHELFATPLPPGLEGKTWPSWIRLYPDKPESRDFPAFLFQASLFVPRTQRLSYIMRAFFIPSVNEEQLVTLPTAISFLYYPLRIVRLSWLVGSHSVRTGLDWVKSRSKAAF